MIYRPEAPLGRRRGGGDGGFAQVAAVDESNAILRVEERQGGRKNSAAGEAGPSQSEFAFVRRLPLSLGLASHVRCAPADDQFPCASWCRMH